MSEITVFISYSHDSDAHRERVLGLSELLRADGIVTILDQYVNGAPAQGWPRWMLDQLDVATFVLVICTETYYRRFRGHEVPGQGKGTDWEGALITQEIYDQRSQTLKFVPVLLSADTDAFIPEPLRSLTRYTLTSDAAYQSLYDFLLSQAGIEPGPIGELKPKPRATGQPAKFGDSPSVPPPGAFRADISRIIKYAPAELIGREAETKLLSDAWDKVRRAETPRPHVLTFVALGGEGKTSLVAKWAAELASQDWLGCEAVLAWSFYSQGTREQMAASSDVFLKEALTFFGDPQMAGSAQGAFDKGRRLAQLVGQRRALLILDGLEPLQYAPTSPTPGELKDQGLAALLKGLAADNHGLCVVTTRYSLPDLRAYWQTTAPEVKLPRLSKEAGVALLRSLGVKGTQPEFEKLVEDVKGHALTLNLLGSYLHDAHAGDIRKRDLVRLEEADAEQQGGHAFRVMDAYVRWFELESSLQAVGRGEPAKAGTPTKGERALAILRLLGLFDRPATADCLDALLKAPAIPGLTEALVGMSEAQRNVAFTRLESAKLLTVHRDAAGTLVSLDAHPLLREYFARQLQEASVSGTALAAGSANEVDPKTPAASAVPLTESPWRAAHRRLYEHLCATTKEGDQPLLEDLQPLYQAVAHGCQAGLQQETRLKVFSQRIRRVNEKVSIRKLGAIGSDLGAIACFFEVPWSRVSPALTEADQAWLLSEAAFCLRALGRLTEALEPMRTGLEMGVEAKDWDEAARRASNLSELELTLGEVAGAVEHAEQSVTYADRSGDAFWKMTSHCKMADALHQAGRRDEAEARFREAEKMQAERQPDYPLLFSLRGFKYCDLLLAAPERAAWRDLLGRARLLQSREEPTITAEERLGGSLALPDLLASCRAVSQRTTQTLKWVEDYGRDILSAALDHLTLGCAALYEAILTRHSSFPGSAWERTALEAPPREPESSNTNSSTAHCEAEPDPKSVPRQEPSPYHTSHFGTKCCARESNFDTASCMC